MRVAIVLDGHDQVEVDEQGQPLLLDALMGGVPKRRGFYPVEGGIGLAVEGEDSALIAHRMTRFNPDVRFMPVEVFPEAEAPAGRKYIVFRDGQIVRFGETHEGRPDRTVVRVDISEDGGRRMFTDYGYLEISHDFSIPEDAVLVPISKPKPEGGYPPDAVPQSTPEETDMARRYVSMGLYLHGLVRRVSE